MTYFGVCAFCHQEVRSPQRPAFPVQGWEVPREQGGTNHVRNRERLPGSVAHETCLPQERNTGEQGTLL